MYSSSNMLRARKKDASFKPNRILDKKSSRGMLYENEELRLRTIHINDEVERGHHDIKKLKKENDHLKREIWYLRDEYEKMEQKFNKVLSSNERTMSRMAGEYNGDEEGGEGGSTQVFYDENGSYILSEDGSPPENSTTQSIPVNYANANGRNGTGRQLNRKISGISAATTTGSVNSMYSSEDEEMNFMLMIDDDDKSRSGNSFNGSVVQLSQHSQQQQGNPPPQGQPGSPPATTAMMEPTGEYQIVETDVESHYPIHEVTFTAPSTSAQAQTYVQYVDVDEDGSPVSAPGPVVYGHHFWHHMTSVPPELEDVKEESESTVNPNSPTAKLNGSSSASASVSSPSPNLNNEIIIENEVSVVSSGLTSPSPNPIIEITPATTPVNSSHETIMNESVPKEETSESEQQQVQHPTGKSHGIQDLGCFALIPEKFQVSSQLKISSAKISSSEIEEETSKNSSSREVHNVRTKSANAKCSTTTTVPVSVVSRRRGSTRRRNSMLTHQQQRRGSVQSTTQSQTLSFPNQHQQQLMSQSPFPFFYQSEPSLRETLFHDDNGSRKYYDYDSSGGRMNYYQHHHQLRCNSGSIGWSCGDNKNVVIGYIEGVGGGGGGDAGASGSNYDGAGASIVSLGVKEIIDQLETQFDPKLENISSVRVMTTCSGSTRIFIILKSSAALKLLVEKGLSLNLAAGAPGEQQQKIPIRLIDAASESSTIVLSGLPPDTLLDSAIISFLNQFGQVTGPLERRLYKGIDISECQIQMHLVKNFPPVLNINGYEIQARICQKQDSVLDGSNLTTTTFVTRPTVAVLQPNANSMVVLPAAVHQPVSRIPLVAGGASAGQSLNLRQVSPAPAPASPNTTPNATPHQTPVPQAKGGHNAVRRSVSSAPRLETGPGPGSSPGAQKSRKMSVCHDVLEEELIAQLANASPKTRAQVHSGSSSNLNLTNNSMSPSPMLVQQQQFQQQQTNYTKKPLTGLPVSSPGNLIPETHQQHSQQQYTSTPGSVSGIPSPGALTSKPFYRSMSFDPRRSSNASSRLEQPLPLSAGMGRLSVQEGGGGGLSHGQGHGPGTPGGGGTPSMIRRVYQAQMSNSSQLDGQSQQLRNGNGNRKLTPMNSTAAASQASDARKPLPWCGCWGNGCL